MPSIATSASHAALMRQIEFSVQRTAQQLRSDELHDAPVGRLVRPRIAPANVRLMLPMGVPRVDNTRSQSHVNSR